MFSSSERPVTRGYRLTPIHSYGCDHGSSAFGAVRSPSRDSVGRRRPRWLVMSLSDVVSSSYGTKDCVPRSTSRRPSCRTAARRGCGRVASPCHRVPVRARALPDDLVPEVLRPEHRVHQHLQVVAGRRVAVQVEATRRLQHAAQLDQARGHHGEVRHHVAVAEERPERLHRLGHLAAGLDRPPRRLARPLSSHCHVSSNALICAAARVPSCSANRTL